MRRRLQNGAGSTRRHLRPQRLLSTGNGVSGQRCGGYAATSSSRIPSTIIPGLLGMRTDATLHGPAGLGVPTTTTHNDFPTDAWWCTEWRLQSDLSRKNSPSWWMHTHWQFGAASTTQSLRHRHHQPRQLRANLTIHWQPASIMEFGAASLFHSTAR